jgi:hypothetical protein
MDIDELIKLRSDLLANSTNEDGYISQQTFLETVLPSAVETGLVESEDINFVSPNQNFNILGYNENESGERLQLFIVDQGSISLSKKKDDLILSRKDSHISHFKLAMEFVKKSMKGHTDILIQDSDPLAVLANQLFSSSFVDKIDVIEIILFSATLAAETRGKELDVKKFGFDDSSVTKKITKNRQQEQKKIDIYFKLVDMGYLYSVSVSKGNADPLKVSFQNVFGSPIEILKAATEEHFESYICVLPATGLANLYKKESSRLLEKNVRSFLNFKGANAGMRNTIRQEPEKFIAFNNGLTITGVGSQIIEKNGKIYLESVNDFQIVNGGQTTASIYFSMKDGLDISKINLMAKINIAKNVSEDELNSLIGDISKYSNTQTKVSNVDLKTSNRELKLIKRISTSVIAPNGNKWYFDLAKGEFSTMVKLKGNKKKLEKEYPRQRRFTKDQLGRYYTAWGEAPYLVKLGGVKVFRYFINSISGDGERKKPKEIDREFFTSLISKVILFRELEDIHGRGKNAIGQLRSSVIPYSISAIYSITSGDKKSLDFNLSMLWIKQGLDNSLRAYLHDLMSLMNDLIKKYAQSDDFAQYAKKEQLWKDIKNSSELLKFLNSGDTLKIINKYGIPKTSKSSKKTTENNYNFELISKAVEQVSKGSKYYKNLISNLNFTLSELEQRKMSRIIQLIKSFKNISTADILFLDEFLIKINVKSPKSFENIENEQNEIWSYTLNKIVENYNQCMTEKLSVISEFDKISQIAAFKEVKYSSIYGVIGNKLSKGEELSLVEIYGASNYYK